jgi:hypothetical protein
MKELDKAKDIYDDAIASGQGAYLLEQRKDIPNVFTASIGNLPPKKAVLITIQYVMELQFEEGKNADKLKFVLRTQQYALNGRDSPKVKNPTMSTGLHSTYLLCE